MYRVIYKMYWSPLEEELYLIKSIGKYSILISLDITHGFIAKQILSKILGGCDG